MNNDCYCVTHETAYDNVNNEMYTNTYFVIEEGEATPEALATVVDVFHAELVRRREGFFFESKEEYAEMVKDSAVTTARGDTMYEVAWDLYDA